MKLIIEGCVNCPLGKIAGSPVEFTCMATGKHQKLVGLSESKTMEGCPLVNGGCFTILLA